MLAQTFQNTVHTHTQPIPSKLQNQQDW